LAGARGSVLDVGAGTGRASLPLARLGHPVTAVERNQGMLAGLAELTAQLPVDIVEGSWPEVAGRVGSHSVSMCAHVVYDVREIAPFLLALADHATGGVVIELTETHPWTHLGPYYQALHGLSRPAGPSADDLAAVVKESLGVAPALHRWTRPPDLWFESRQEIIELYGRRLVLPRSRWPELDRLLDSEIIEKDGRYLFGADARQFVTLWWARS
jgi:SAM-dependent methyltransferase